MNFYQSVHAIVAIYVDDLNLVGTLEELTKIANCLKNEFEMKDLGKTKFCLGLQSEHLPNEILVHQSTYIEKVLKQFYINKAHPLSTPMVGRSLDVKKDPFQPQEDDEETLGPEVPYLSAIGALMYLANCTQPDIAFVVNLLARYSSAPTQRHWNGIKHILRYLRGTTDLGLFYPNGSKPQLVGYADAGYLSDPHKGRSQSGYLFTYGNTIISWRSVKQTISTTSSNHAEIIAVHEVSHECVWLRSVIQHIHENCGLSSIIKVQRYYTKIMLLVSLKLGEDISRVIKTSILHQIFFIHISTRRVAILMSSRYDHVIIWPICSLSHYQLRILRRWCTTLVCINLRIFLPQTMEILCTHEGE